jgi:hypothetical protein
VGPALFLMCSYGRSRWGSIRPAWRGPFLGMGVTYHVSIRQRSLGPASRVPGLLVRHTPPSVRSAALVSCPPQSALGCGVSPPLSLRRSSIAVAGHLRHPAVPSRRCVPEATPDAHGRHPFTRPDSPRAMSTAVSECFTQPTSSAQAARTRPMTGCPPQSRPLVYSAGAFTLAG